MRYRGVIGRYETGCGPGEAVDCGGVVKLAVPRAGCWR
jgi:hypothetical protein